MRSRHSHADKNATCGFLSDRFTLSPTNTAARATQAKNDRQMYRVAGMALGEVAILGAPLAVHLAQPPPRALKKVQPTRPGSYLWHELDGLCTYQVMG